MNRIFEIFWSVLKFSLLLSIIYINIILIINTSNKFIIPIAYATDNGYTIPTLVSITSLLESIKFNETFYDIYIMISKNFTKDNKIMLKSLTRHYPLQCKVHFINMSDLFIEQKKSPTSMFYRLALPDNLTQIDKIIYLDGDTMVFDDLTELYNINMTDNYILGFLDSLVNALQKYGIKDGVVLNSGVLLMDLKVLRNFNATTKFKQFMQSQDNNVDQDDQTTINYVLQGHLHSLPPKYGMWGFTQYGHAIFHNNVQRHWLKYNETELKEAFEHPAILHYTAGKPFKDNDAPYNETWWNHANKTGYYEIISNYSFNKRFKPNPQL